LNLYTSGGVEKVPETKEKKGDTGSAKLVKSRRSEAVIKRNEDGTTSIVYPDSDEDDEDVQVPTEVGEATPVVKGSTSKEKSNGRITGEGVSTDYTKYPTYIHNRSSMARKTSGQIWRRLRQNDVG